jgi:predicted Rossmann-fold nucleotide-binding protein
VRERFLRPEHRDLIQRADEPAALLDALEAWEPRAEADGVRPRELR